MDPEDDISIEELSEAAGVPPARIRVWIQRDLFPRGRVVSLGRGRGRKAYWPRSAIELAHNLARTVHEPAKRAAHVELSRIDDIEVRKAVAAAALATVSGDREDLFYEVPMAFSSWAKSCGDWDAPSQLTVEVLLWLRFAHGFDTTRLAGVAPFLLAGGAQRLFDLLAGGGGAYVLIDATDAVAVVDDAGLLAADGVCSIVVRGRSLLAAIKQRT